MKLASDEPSRNGASIAYSWVRGPWVMARGMYGRCAARPRLSPVITMMILFSHRRFNARL